MRKLMLAIALLFASLAFAQTAPPGTTLVASDSFTRANSTTTMGANWTVFSGTWGISSDAAYLPTCSASQYCTTYYSGTLPGVDPYVTFKASTWSIGQNPGIVLVNSSDAGYMLACIAYSGSNCTSGMLEKSANFSTTLPTTLKTVTVSWATGTAISLYDNAGSLTVYANGTINSSFTTSDSTYIPTRAGLSEYQAAASAAFSYFEEGNLTPSGLATPTCLPAAGTVNNSVSTACTIVGGATGCYTLSGTAPTAPTAGTCGSGSTQYTGTVSITSSAASNLQILATESGQTNSSVASYAYTLQVATPVPVYGPSGAMTFTQATTGAAMYYNNTGSTATCASTLYSGAVYASGTNPISIIGCLSGYTNSTVVSVQPDIPVASDNFQSYYNSNYGSGFSVYGLGNLGPPYQSPIDCNWTGTGAGTTCNWSALSLITGQEKIDFYPVADTVLGGSNINLIPWGFSGSSLTTDAVASVRTGEGYYQNQGSLAYLHTASSSSVGDQYGVGVRCSSSYCMTLWVGGGTAALSKYVSGSYTNIVNVGSGVTYSDGAYVELRAEGSCVFRLLLNGLPIPGFAATYTDAGCPTTGQPSIVAVTTGHGVASNAIVYNWSGYNVGGTSGAYTPPTVAAYQTYTDAMNTSGYTTTPPLSTPWFQYNLSGYWLGTYAAVSTGGGYAGGITNAGEAAAQLEYRNVFSTNQWSTATINVNVFDARFDNYFMPLLHSPFIPGLLNGGCATAGTTATCYDPAAIYVGLEPMNIYGASGCSKFEYCDTPFWHITTVDPVNSTGDQVNTLVGSTTTLMNGDQVYEQVSGGWVDAYCKQSSTPLPTWSLGMTMTAGTTYVEGGGMVWLASTSGIAGATQPSWPGSASWNTTTHTGTYVSDGTGVWKYYGDTCPTDAAYTRIMHAYYPFLSNPASTAGGLTSPLGTGFPSVWGQGKAVPLFSNTSMGSVGYGSGNPCGIGGGPSATCLAPSMFVMEGIIP